MTAAGILHSQILVSHFTTPFSGRLQGRIKNLVEHHNRAFLEKILNGFFKLLAIFARKAPSQMFDWIKNRLLAKGLKY